MKLKLGFLVVGWGLLHSLVIAQDTVAMHYAKLIEAEQLRYHLEIIASDAYEGRETGKPGQKMAATYIADYFSSLGVPPSVNGGYFQEFPLRNESIESSALSFGGKSYTFKEDYYFFPGFPTTVLKGNSVVFVGYGVEDESYSDYADLDVRNRVVLMLDGEPVRDGKFIVTNSTTPSDFSSDWRLKRDIAMSKGASAVIMLNTNYAQILPRIQYWLDTPGMKLDRKIEEKEQVLPVFFASPKMFAGMLKSSRMKSVDALAKTLSANKKLKKREIKVDYEIEVIRKTERFTSENVLCFIPGRDPKLAHEVLVLTAHYDHIGTDGVEINNGADDDGSGTVTILELAKAFKRASDEGFAPRRSVLLMTVSGEEKGLLGSEWYTTYPIYPLENTVANLNIDMIGRTDAEHSDENYIYLIGSDRLSTELHEISETCNSLYTGLALDYTYNDEKDPNRYYYRSDHYNFAKNNIPVIFYFSGVHEDYHKPGDTADKIRYEKMEKIARLVFHTAWEIANRDERPQLNEGVNAQ
jgi:hypothetical protein